MANPLKQNNSQQFIVRIDPEISELVPQFLEHSRQKIQFAKAAVANNDRQSILSFAHKLKGSARLYGFNTLSDIASAMEKEAPAASMESLQIMIEHMTEWLDHIEIKYE